MCADLTYKYNYLKLLLCNFIHRCNVVIYILHF